jgi:hypothetical protein
VQQWMVKINDNVSSLEFLRRFEVLVVRQEGKSNNETSTRITNESAMFFIDTDNCQICSLEK